jgi:hypothetical protein
MPVFSILQQQRGYGCTTAKLNDDRQIIAQLNTSGAVSSVGTGSTTACTGTVSRSVVSAVKYVVIVTYESPLPRTFPTSAGVQFTGPVTISGPRLRSGGPEEIQTCKQITENAITAAAVDVESVNCGTLMTCKISSSGDTDAFTFMAAAGYAYSITISEQTAVAGFPCWELRGPTGNYITSSCGRRAAGPLSAGKHTIETYGVGFVGDYRLSLQLVSQ